MSEETMVVETPTKVVPESSVAPKGILKLTSEEENRRLLFIGRCVDKNVTYPNTTKFGSQVPLTIQEISACNEDTLRNLGEALEKIASKGASKFAKDSEVLKVSGIPVDDWMDFLLLTLKRKEYLTWARKRNSSIRVLKASIDAARTPQEIREQAEAELALLGEEEVVD